MKNSRPSTSCVTKPDISEGVTDNTSKADDLLNYLYKKEEGDRRPAVLFKGGGYGGKNIIELLHSNAQKKGSIRAKRWEQEGSVGPHEREVWCKTIVERFMVYIFDKGVVGDLK